MINLLKFTAEWVDFSQEYQACYAVKDIDNTDKLATEINQILGVHND